MRLTNALAKQIRSLHTAKGRRAVNAFLAEGTKAVHDMLPYYKYLYLLATAEWQDAHGVPDNVITVNREEMNRLTGLSTASDVMAVFEMPDDRGFDISAVAKNDLIVACDGIQDPGNLGTIIRTSLWFGINHFLLSTECASLYNPKTVQATMGALPHIRYVRGGMEHLLAEAKAAPVYGTFLTNSDNLFEANLTTNGVIVLGSEGRGIDPSTEPLITHRLHIPAIGNGHHPESLNVSAAAAVIISRFRYH